MTEDVLERPAHAPRRPGRRVTRWITPNLLRGVRWAAVVVWAATFAEDIYENGIPYFRSDLLLWIAVGLVAASIGKRNVLTVVLDFVPFGLVLIGYDYLRGVSDSLGMPTWWHPQVDVDKFLFFGREPTVWLQEHLLYRDVRWWDVLVALCYVSFFFLPYVTAAVLWLRNRRDFYRWSLRFVALSFIAFTFFALTPAAPPWAAAKCTALQIADHAYDPPCMHFVEGRYPGNLLGPMTTHRPGVTPWVHRMVGRGFADLNLHFAAAVIKTGQLGVDLVAAVPSLHAGGIMLFTIFMWRRVQQVVATAARRLPGVHGFHVGVQRRALLRRRPRRLACRCRRMHRGQPHRAIADTPPPGRYAGLFNPQNVEISCPPTSPQPAMTLSSI